MRPAHPETEETALATTPAAQAAPPVRPVSLAEGSRADAWESAWAVWEAIELWWLAFLARLIARGEDVPLCACCEAKMCGLADGSQRVRSPMGVYLAAAPGLSARARRHLARGIANLVRAMRACGESWRAWVCDRLRRSLSIAKTIEARAAVAVSESASDIVVARGPPGIGKNIDMEPSGSPPARAGGA